jgi:hypothetical protein
MPAPLPPLRALGLLLLFGVLGGTTFATAWWLGPENSGLAALIGVLAALPVGWGITRIGRLSAPLTLFLGVVVVHLGAGIGGVVVGLPLIEVAKLLLQGALLGGLAGSRVLGSTPIPLIVAATGFPVLFALLTAQQKGLEVSEGARLQEVIASSIARGSAFPDSTEVGPNARVWVIDRASSRIVAAPDARGGELGELGLEHPGMVVTEPAGSYATRRGEHAVVAWRAVPRREDVGVVIVIYEPTSEFNGAMAWTLLGMLAVMGMGVVLVGKRQG